MKMIGFCATLKFTDTKLSLTSSVFELKYKIR